jgi:uncharacterized membrane protein YdfJ with MMPL/SSD domain
VTLSTEGLARASSRRPWRTIAVWGVLVVAAIGATAALLPGALTTDVEVTNNPESERAARVLQRHFPPTHDNPAVAGEILVVRSESHAVEEPAFRRFVARLVREGRSRRVVFGARSYLTDRDPSLVSGDRHATIVPLLLGGEVDPLLDLVRQSDGREGFRVAITGSHTLDADFDALSQHDLESGELQFGLPAALIILVAVFGAVVAGLLPLVMALVSIAIALGFVAALAHVLALSVFVVNMLTGMGLALGIDYALFVVSRYREERVHGREKLDAIAAAGATASRAVLFSGSVFVIALVGMLLVPDSVLRSLALGAILVGVVSVLAALTLLPAVLSLLGDRVNALALPVLGRTIETSGREGRLWGAVIRAVMRRPAASLAVTVAALVAAAVPVLALQIGHNGVETVPDRFLAKQGFLALQRDFARETADPVFVAVEGDAAAPRIRAALSRFAARVAADGDFGPPAVRYAPDGRAALVVAPVRGDPEGDRAADAVRRLRGELVPEAFSGTHARVLVGGTTAEDVDYFDTIRSWMPIVLAFVLGLTFLLLTVVFRSLVVPLKAIVLNLLSVGAAYGLLVLVFQKGYLADLFGFQQVDTIEAWVPLFLFSVLFALSMDYHVFLLTRIRERFGQTGDSDESVAFGIGSTARLITGAALIIVAVFSGFAAGDLVMFQQMGFGIAVSLLLDATIVRSVLLPAAMKLLGRRNWYLPRWLEWLPELQVEGPPHLPPARVPA